LIEAVADFDEGLLEAYASDQEVSAQHLREAIRGATLRGEVVPVLCGSSLHNKGIQPLLDAVLDFLPSPLEGQPVLGQDPQGAVVPCLPDEGEPFAAVAFKLMGDAREGALTYFRVYAGRLRAGAEVLNSSRGERVRVGALVRMHANDREEIAEVSVGDIAAAVSLEGVLTGDTLCDPARPLVLSAMSFPEPVIERRIEPQTVEEAQKLEGVLGRLALEDPSFRVRVDPDSGQTLIAGMGELHLEILGERITREWKVQARLGAPQVAYRETVMREGRARGRFERQIVALRAVGEVEVRVRPLGRGEGLRLTVEDAGQIPAAHLEAVDEGLREAVRRGFVAGFPLVDAEVAVVGGGAPAEGSSAEASAMAYRLAAATALREAVSTAGGRVLEPIMSLEVLVPGEFLGAVMGDLQRREARVEELEGRGEVQAIAAWAPLRTMFGHATGLRSQTQGRGTCSMRFDHYEPAAEALAQALAGRAWGQT
jgi:elongation factor G